MADVYRITTADGQEFAWHGSAAELKKAHPGATITARLVPDDIRGGTWEPTTDRQAAAAEKKAAEPEPEKPARPAAKPEPEQDAVVVVVDEAPTKRAGK